MQVGRQGEEEIQRRNTTAEEKWRVQTAGRNRLKLVQIVGDLVAKWKIIPDNDTKLEEVMATAMRTLVEQQCRVPGTARIGGTGLRRSQEHRWVAIGPEARQEMEEWICCLDSDTPGTSPFQLEWAHQQLVLSQLDSGWASEISNSGAGVQERE